jgi:quercetin dioxygenase-like cupin family protein
VWAARYASAKILVCREPRRGGLYQPSPRTSELRRPYEESIFGQGTTQAETSKSGTLAEALASSVLRQAKARPLERPDLKRSTQMYQKADTVHGQGTHGVEGAQRGEAAVNTPPGQGKRTLWVLGEAVTYKVSSRRTGGAYAMFEVATPPGAGPPPHVQHREDESFYVLEGEYEFLMEGSTIRAGAGSLLYFPKGTLHAHNGVGEGVGRMLVTQTPGGLYERFFEELGKVAEGDDAEPPVFEEQADAESIVATAAKYGIEIPPPYPKVP